jgi:hypothetical protein
MRTGNPTLIVRPRHAGIVSSSIPAITRAQSKTAGCGEGSTLGKKTPIRVIVVATTTASNTWRATERGLGTAPIITSPGEM